jgi:hypothetical protein
MNPYDNASAIAAADNPADANRNAQWLPPGPRAPGLGGDKPPRIVVAGAVVAIYVTDEGELVIDPDLSGAADWLRGRDGRVALRLVDGGKPVLRARVLPPEPPPDPAVAPVVSLRGPGRQRSRHG